MENYNEFFTENHLNGEAPAGGQKPGLFFRPGFCYR